ncbi:MAG: glycosyl transferase family 2, partial [Cellulomonas sp.]|nr:glycosyl transferase family 2 [Cellulomonas sp.]
MHRPGTPRLLVILPAWNEEEALPGVLDELHAAI